MMMMALSLAAMVQAAPTTEPAIPPMTDADIVVVARRLSRIFIHYDYRGGVFSCRTIKSSGDAEIDATFCAAYEQCLPEVRAQFDANEAAALPAYERQRRHVAIENSMRPCAYRTYVRDEKALFARRAAR